MGGTSTDVALIDGELQLTSEGRIGSYPVAIPMVDMHTIGAGGGSIASIDAGGLLQVGPQSAGADPGPACYGQGGTYATVTDANLVLGRLRADAFLGGHMVLDITAARKAIRTLASHLNISIEVMAEGIVRLANEHMARALRVMSVQRGIDPRKLTLVSFGGAGGLHVCALAEALSMRQALVPVNAGVLSAVGMLVAPRARFLSQSISGVIESINEIELNKVIDELTRRGKDALMQEGVIENEIEVIPSVDVRYRGQSYSLNIEWLGKQKTANIFHFTHQQRYGHRLDQPVELVTARIKVYGKKNTVEAFDKLLKKNVSPGEIRSKHAPLHGYTRPVPVIERDKFPVGQIITGPA